MESTMADYAKLVNGAGASPAKEGQNVYIGRRTGRVIKINARKDSHGFERIEDYFPDSEDEEEENKSYVTEPVKLKPNQYIGRRTGALIEINARKDSHGFELIEDYFPDSIRVSDVSTLSNKDLSNISKLSASVNISELQEKSQEDEAIEEKKSMLQLLGSKEKSHVSRENKDIVTPHEKETDISLNLTGTAVKNSATSAEPTPQFFGSKKRLFPSAEIKDIMSEKITEAEEDVDIVGVSDEEEEETNAQSGQNANNAEKEKQVFNTTAEDDTMIIDVDGVDTPCVTLNDKSRGSKVRGDVQEDKDTGGKTKDDTLMVDIEDDNTFVTLGDKSKVSKLKNMSRDNLVTDNEESYQMDESVVLEGTKHKAMSPDFGSVSTYNSRTSGAENDVTEEMARPKGRQTRKSEKSVPKKSFKEQEVEDEEDDYCADKFVDHQADDNAKPNVKKTRRISKKSVSNKSIGEKQEKVEDDEKDGDHADNYFDHQADDHVSIKPAVKKATRKSSKKSVSNKSIKEEQEVIKENITANVTNIDETKEDDTVYESSLKKATRKSKKSMSNKSIKEKEEEANNEDIFVNLTSADQTNEDDTVHVSLVKKATRKSKKSMSNKSIKEKQVEEDMNEKVPAETKANQKTEDEKAANKRAARKSTRRSQKEYDNEKTTDAVEEELEERVMTRRATRSNTSKHAILTSTSLNDKTFNKKSGKKTPIAPGRRSTRSKNKSMASDKSSIFGESKSEKSERESKSMGEEEDESSDDMEHEIQGEDGGNFSLLLKIEDDADMPSDAECEVNDNDVYDTQGGEERTDTTKEGARKRRSTRNKSQVNDDKSKSETECEVNDTSTEVHDTQKEEEYVDTLNDRARNRRSTRSKSKVNNTSSKSQTKEESMDGEVDGEKQSMKNTSLVSTKSQSETEELLEAESMVVMEDSCSDSNYDAHGDDEQESQEILKKPTKINKKVKGRKTEKKGAAWRATINNQVGDDDDDDDDDEKDQDGDENNSKVISKKAKTTSKGRRRKSSSSSALDSDKDGVGEKKEKPKRKRKTIKKIAMTNHSRRKPNRTSTETTGSDLTDQEGMADEGDDDIKEDESRQNDTSVDKSINKTSRKRTHQTRIESIRAAESSTPVGGSPYILPPGSVKSILKSSIPRTLSADAKKHRVSIATIKKDTVPNADDNVVKSKSPGRRRSSVSFAPTPSFRITPDDFSTPEESPDELGQLSFVTNYSGFSLGDKTFTPGVRGSASLSSSVSSLASLSNLTDSSTLSESQEQEITINSAKKRQIIEDEGQDDSGVRRSKRTKVPPLEYWKNERIKYERRQSGWFVSGIEKVTTPEVPKRKYKPRKEKKKGAGRRKTGSCEEDDSDFHEEPADMEEVTYTSIPVINPDNGEQVELDLVHTPQMANFVNVSGKTATREDPLIVDKFMSHNLFGAGQIVLRPGAEKGKQHVRDDTMVFYVVKGRVEVTLHETTVLLPTGSTFFVPTGNFYDIKNVHNSDTRLMFVQIKG